MRSFIDILGVLLAILAASVCGLACSDGPSGPPSPRQNPWAVVTLPDSLPSSGLTGVAFKGTRGLVVGSTGSSGAKPDYLLESNGGDWTKRSLPVDTNDFLLAVAIDDAGGGVIVGANMSGGGSPVVLAERPDWTRVTLPVANGGLQALAVDTSGSFLATGPRGSSVLALTGTANGIWTTESITLPGDPQEKSLVDLAYNAGTWAACGFDDGANNDEDSPYHVVLANDGTGWTLLKGIGCGGCGMREYRAVAVNQQGAILLGGAITDFSFGAPDEYVAFLSLYSPATQQWTEIVLPDAGTLDRVNDILVAANGDVYLACGIDSTTLVHHYAAGITIPEWSDGDVVIQQLAQATNGDIYAVGSKAPQNSFAPSPFMLQRHVSLFD